MNASEGSNIPLYSAPPIKGGCYTIRGNYPVALFKKFKKGKNKGLKYPKSEIKP